METMQSERDRLLWKVARKRVGFKNHLYMYLIINGFLWAMWLFTGRRGNENGIPWPVFSSLGWGFGLFWHFMGAYVFDSKSSQVEKEYERLRSRQS